MVKHYDEPVSPRFAMKNTKEHRGEFVPVALVTRDALDVFRGMLDINNIDSKVWMYPPKPDLPETQFVLYKVEVKFDDEETASRILSNLIHQGPGDRL